MSRDFDIIKTLKQDFDNNIQCRQDIRDLSDEFRKHDLAMLKTEKEYYEAYLLASKCDYSHHIQSGSFPIFAVLLTAALFLFSERMDPKALESYSLAIFIVIAALLVAWVCKTLSVYKKTSMNKYYYTIKLSVINKVIEEKESKASFITSA
jgi:hypothetical protein